MMGFPIAISYFYDLWPTWKDVWPGFVTVVLILAPYWVAEVVGYMPVMGPGAIYMSYITGNVTNLRMPVTIGTIQILGIEPSTEECHVMAIIACGTSIITSVLIIMLGIFIAMPMAPILNNPALKPAFDNVISALFGGLVAQTVIKSRRDFLMYLPPLAINLFFCFYTKVNSAYYMLIGLAVAIVISIVAFNKENKKNPSPAGQK
jgi:hypothetical protein